MTAYLTGDEIAQRRTELGQVEEQLKALGRRRSVLRAEILSGFAAPVKGAAPEQLPLVETAPTATTATPAPEAPSHAPEAAKPAAAARSAIQLREAVLELLRAAKGRRSRRVLATLLGESEADVHECLMELIERGEARSARRGGYEATDKPQARGRDTKPGKGQKKPAAAPPAEPIVLGDMTMTEVRQVLLDEIGTWTRWHSGAAADHALWEKLRESGHDDEDGFDLGRNVDKVGQEALTALAKEGRIQYSEAPGNWNNSYAPLGVPRTAEGGPDEPRPPRAKKASKKAPAKSAKPAAKKAAKKAPSKGKKAPAPPPPTRTVGEAVEKILGEVQPQQWREARELVAYRLTSNKGYPIPVAGLYLAGNSQGAEIDAVLSLLFEAGAVYTKSSGPIRLVEVGAAVDVKSIVAEMLRLTHEFVLELIDGSDTTTDDLARSLEVPCGLVLSVLEELQEAGRIVQGARGRWQLSAAARTAPLFDDVEPAPAGEEAAE